MSGTQRSEEGVGVPGPGVPVVRWHIGAGTRALVLEERSQCLTAPKFIFLKDPKCHKTLTSNHNFTQVIQYRKTSSHLSDNENGGKIIFKTLSSKSLRNK